VKFKLTLQSVQQQSGLTMFIASLETDSKFVHSGVANSCMFERPPIELCARRWQFVSELPTAAVDGAVTEWKTGGLL
jgi:hypothetical protein